MPPRNFIEFNSTQSKTLLRNAISQMGLVKRSFDQINRKYCGPVSLAISIGYLLKSNLFKVNDKIVNLEDENDFVENTDAGRIMTVNKVNVQGVTLNILSQAASTLNQFRTEEIYCVEDAPGKTGFDIDLFRNMLKKDLTSSNVCVIANYHMGVLGWHGCKGHFSPIGAYHGNNDMVLILDTWPDTPSGWVRLPCLYKAMKAIDDDSGKPRGLLKLYKKD